MPRPTWAADSPVTWVKKTALPVRKTPSPTANSTDCVDSRRVRRSSGSSRSSRGMPRITARRPTFGSRGFSRSRAEQHTGPGGAPARPVARRDAEPEPLVVDHLGVHRARPSGCCSRAPRCSPRCTRARAGSAAAGAGCSPCPPTYVAGVQVVCRSLVAGHAPALLGPGGLAGRRTTSTTSPWCRPSCTGCWPTPAETRVAGRPAHGAARRRADRPRAARARRGGRGAGGRDVRLGRDRRRLRLRRPPARRRRASPSTSTAGSGSAGPPCSAATTATPR